MSDNMAFLRALAKAKAAVGDLSRLDSLPPRRRQAVARAFAINTDLSRNEHQARAQSYLTLAHHLAAILNRPTMVNDFDRLVERNAAAYGLAQLHLAAARSKVLAF